MPMTGQQFLEKLSEINAASEAYIQASPGWVQYWIYWMMAIIALSFILALFKKEARVIALASAYSMLLTPIINLATDGPTLLWGLAHILTWGPVVLWLASRRLRDVGVDSLYGKWLITATLTMAVSLVFDFYDVYRFLSS